MGEGRQGEGGSIGRKGEREGGRVRENKEGMKKGDRQNEGREGEI